MPKPNASSYTYPMLQINTSLFNKISTTKFNLSKIGCKTHLLIAFFWFNWWMLGQVITLNIFTDHIHRKIIVTHTNQAFSYQT